MSQDKRIDAYIAKSADFAQPILTHIRKLVHKSCPKVEETIKWGFPNFVYGGAILCFMASFKKHCSFGFWKGSLMTELSETINEKGETAMGNFGKLTSVKDLPSDKKMAGYIKSAMKLNEEGVKLPNRAPVKKGTKELVVPDYILKALSKNKKAKGTFEAFGYSHKKEYVQWIEEAKTEPTRNKRIATMMEWLKEGKGRNWKYS